MLTYFLLIQYTIYALFIRHPNYCKNAREFYHIINLLIYGFFIRILLCFIDYMLHFKLGINTEEEERNNYLYKDVYNRVPEEVLNMIETTILSDSNINKLVPLTNENERDICCICMIPFSVGDLVRLMPCDKKHIFHKACIDKWLSHNKSCPTCRTEITRKLISIKKID